jgi:hypothetical protein
VTQGIDLKTLSHAEKDELILSLVGQLEAARARIGELETRLARLERPAKTPDNSSLPPSQGQKPARATGDKPPRKSRPGFGRLERSEPSEEVDNWANGMLPRTGRRETMGLLRTMTLRIQEEFTYTHRGEWGVQSPGVTMQRGSGTCRDFAWLMIDAVRSLGLAARFVSGYIFVPNAVSTEMVGGGSTHAWLQVYLPGAGWVDFDPTNSIIGNRNLIRVAVAWHPASVLPLWGTFTGVPGSALNMQVDVTVTEEFDSSAQTASRDVA